MNNTFEACARIHLDNADRRADAVSVVADLATLSSLVSSSAQPSAGALKEIFRRHDAEDQFRNFCLRAVAYATNPFIPGMILSVRLREAAKQVTGGEHRAIVDTASSVDELLLGMLERLPQTVKEIDDLGGVDACATMFEPPGMKQRTDWIGLGGPLEIILTNHQQLQTFCKVPLVFDYLSTKFMLGLPDLNDTEGILRNAGQLEQLARDNGLVLGDGGKALSGVPWFGPGLDEERIPPRTIFAMFKHPRTLLQAAHALVPNLVFFPGAQFAVAGVVAAPSSYYRVPAMRMALDFVVYLGMVALVSYFVLFHDAARGTRDGVVVHDFSWEEGACGFVFITVRSSCVFFFLSKRFPNLVVVLGAPSLRPSRRFCSSFTPSSLRGTQRQRAH